MRGVFLLGVSLAVSASALSQSVELKSGSTHFTMELQQGRYGFPGSVAPAKDAGVLLDGSPVSFTKSGVCNGSRCVLNGTSAKGAHLKLTVALTEHTATLIAEPQAPGSELRFVTAGAAPAYGLGDHAVEQQKFTPGKKVTFDTEVSGFSDDGFISGQGQVRLASNFVIYPKQKFAELLIDPTQKIVETSATQITQGVKYAPAKVELHYFFGDPHAIYAAYKDARNNAGYKVWMPKYEAFGVGWEAFGALAWDTNTNTVRDSIDRYLQLGYPLKWVVIGSGFWPQQPDTMHETTSFGYWDKEKYPDPKGLIQHFKDEKLTVMLGLRITFIVGGPWSDEGVRENRFIQENGKPKIYTGGWPKQPYYLLNAQDPKAVDWYMSLVKKWQDYGITGWKEDFYGYGKYPELRDDKVDPTNERLMAQKQLIIERNGYLSSNGDLHRINDFNYNQDQDRGPVNALAFAYSGFPYVYPDIVGGTFGESHFNTNRTARMQIYMQRNAQWAALHASMGMGEPPWSFSPETAKVMLDSARLHERIAPYLFSNARRAYIDGYPWTMTPLPLAFPNDPAAYGRENAHDRAYEWLIGDAMLATPLYGNDYDTATTRDVYLPEGRWMDYDTGKLYPGNQTLKAFPLPAGKTPLFIGGSGVTLEQIAATPRICVYPVATNAQATLTLPESDKAIAVSVHGLGADAAWSGISVKDSKGKTVEARAEGHGFSFVPAAGEHYTVTAKK